MIGLRSGAGQVSRSMSSPISRHSSLFMSATVALRSNTRGSITCRRLKASSCRVTAAARKADFWMHSTEARGAAPSGRVLSSIWV